MKNKSKIKYLSVFAFFSTFLLGGGYADDEPRNSNSAVCSVDHQPLLDRVCPTDGSRSKKFRRLDCFISKQPLAAQALEPKTDDVELISINSLSYLKEFKYSERDGKYCIEYDDEGLIISLPMNSVGLCFDEEKKRMHLVKLTNEHSEPGKAVFATLASSKILDPKDSGYKYLFEDLRMNLELVRTGLVTKNFRFSAKCNKKHFDYFKEISFKIMGSLFTNEEISDHLTLIRYYISDIPDRFIFMNWEKTLLLLKNDPDLLLNNLNKFCGDCFPEAILANPETTLGEKIRLIRYFIRSKSHRCEYFENEEGQLCLNNRFFIRYDYLVNIIDDPEKTYEEKISEIKRLRCDEANCFYSKKDKRGVVSNYIVDSPKTTPEEKIRLLKELMRLFQLDNIFH